MNGAGKDSQIDVGGDIFLPLSIIDFDALGGQFFRDGRFLSVGTGYRKAPASQDLRQTAHGNTADADEVDMDRLGKINLIHKLPHFLISVGD